MHAPHKENRIAIRTDQMSINASVSRDGLDWTDVVGSDISETGFGFISTDKFPPGLEIRVDGEVCYLELSKNISCKIKIMSCCKAGNENFRYGASFVDMAHNQQVELGAFIEQVVARLPKLLSTPTFLDDTLGG